MLRRPEEGRVGGVVCGLQGFSGDGGGAAYQMDVCEAGGRAGRQRGLSGGAWSRGTLGAGRPGPSGCGSGNWVVDGSFSLGEGTA